jgi:exopolysaccharide production protein ExoQ
MPPLLALLAWLGLVLWLLYRDHAHDRNASPALWIPLLWFVILGSRLPSQWLGQTPVSAIEAYQEGSLLDRSIYLMLIMSAVWILMARSIRWGDLFAHNTAMMLFLLFTLLSITWSDFPFVSFKRWIRDLGNYLVILVILSDPRPLLAVQTVLRRLCYVLIPLSVVLIKYYPHLGRGYSEWTGVAYYMGAATTKNMLGVLCLISGIFFFWDTVRRWGDRGGRERKRIILVNGAFMGMTLWLLNLADSATSRVCLVIACLVIGAAHSRAVRINPGRLKVLIPGALCMYVVLEFGFNITDVVAQAVGRDPSLTGRTDLWNDLLGVNTDPLVGAGYESFWLGDRLHAIWAKHPFRPNQAHNGYLEVYLNLGLLGLCLLGGFLISSYRRACTELARAGDLASLSLALWTILLFYNMTEAAFKSQLLWSTFLLGAVAAPVRGEEHSALQAREGVTG